MLFCTFIGFTIAVIPITTKKLNIFDPTTFAIAMSFWPFNAAVTLTAASGALVPNATIVSPINNDGILNFLAIDDAPDTNPSAPLINNKNPINNKM